MTSWRHSRQLPGVKCAGPRSVRRACVIIPVRNEAETIAATLDALAMQQGVDPGAFEIIVLANNCVDDSVERVNAARRRHPHLTLDVIECDFPEENANVGAARKLLMDEAARRLPSGGIIASTDGDTVVDAHWLAATFQEFSDGADVVGGRILARSPSAAGADLELRRIHLTDTMYRHLIAAVEDVIDPDPADPWPRHFQHFGASLAITRDAYLGLGGLPRVPHLEDMALYDAARRADARIRHSPRVRAVTSARLGGRVGMGLSTQLGEWQALAKAGAWPIVESADFVIARIRDRRRLREIWSNAGDRMDEMTFGCLLEREHTAFCAAAARLEPLDDAVANLRQRLAPLHAGSRAAPISAALEDIEPVRFRPLTAQMEERSA